MRARRRPLGGLLAAARGRGRRPRRPSAPDLSPASTSNSVVRLTILPATPNRSRAAVKRLHSQAGRARRVARGGPRCRIGARRDRQRPRARRRTRSSSTTRSRSRPPTRGGPSIPTASLVDHALYDTLFTYKGGDLAHPIPLLVSSWKASRDAKTFTFQLKKNVHFADGTPLTSADVVWSLKRLAEPEGQPVVPARGRSRSRRPPSTRSSCARRRPATQLPVILANPSTGILNSALVKKNGGTDAANAAKADKAENWLNSPASVGAGSGPFTLSAYSTTSQITLTPNAKLLGREEVRVDERGRPQHGRRDAAAERRPRLARDRRRPVRRPGRDAVGQQERQRRRCSPRRGSSSSTRTTTRRSRRSRRTRTSRRRSGTGSTTPRS